MVNFSGSRFPGARAWEQDGWAGEGRESDAEMGLEALVFRLQSNIFPLLHPQLLPACQAWTPADWRQGGGGRWLGPIRAAPELFKEMNCSCHLCINSLPLLFLSPLKAPNLGSSPCN